MGFLVSFHEIISGSFSIRNVRFANSDKDLSQEEFYERWPGLKKRFKLFGMGHGPMEDYLVYRRERRQELMPAERGGKKVRPRNKIDASGICPEDMENLESWDAAGFDENAFVRIEGRRRGSKRSFRFVFTFAAKFFMAEKFSPKIYFHLLFRHNGSR